MAMHFTEIPRHLAASARPLSGLIAPNAPLAMIFVNFDRDERQLVGRGRSESAVQPLEQLLADVAGQKLRRRVGNRQQYAVLSGENPAPIFKRCGHFSLVGCQANRGVLGC